MKWTVRKNEVAIHLKEMKHCHRGKDYFRGMLDLILVYFFSLTRFERKAAQKKNMVFYDGQFCETEELPNGFVKVRSKHLDVLFKGSPVQARNHFFIY